MFSLRFSRFALLVFSILVGLSGSIQASDEDTLAKQLVNPVADLISVPFQFNYDRGIGAGGEGSRVTVNVQPVIPFSLNDNWNLISRTIVPLTTQNDVVPGSRQTGVGDIVQSIFFSPKAPTAGGLIWGVGPVFLLPTATDNALGADTFAAGPTAVALWQKNGWTYGGLINHLWDVGGPMDVSATFYQPFVARALGNGQTLTLQVEGTHDWVRDTDSIPVSLIYSKVTTFGKQPVSLAGGIRYYADSAPGGPSGWAARIALTYLFPK